MARNDSFFAGIRKDTWGHTLLVLITAISIAALVFVSGFLVVMIGKQVYLSLQRDAMAHTIPPIVQP